MKKLISDEANNKLTKIFSEEPNVIAVYVFGSRAKGNAIKSSDLDIAAVCFNKKNVNLRKLIRRVQEIFPEFETDFSLADIEGNPIFLMQVINGKVIYQKSQSQRAKLETAILHLYEYSENFRHIDDYYLNKSFKEGVYAYR